MAERPTSTSSEACGTRASPTDDGRRCCTTGFGYAKYPGSESYFGLSLSHPAWVVRQLTTLGGLRLVSLSEKSWVEFHDVVAAVRDPDCAADTRTTSGARYLRHMALDRMNPHVRSRLERIRSWR